LRTNRYTARPVTLASILSVEEIDGNTWRAWTPPGTRRPDIYGGQVAGQALRAACLTIDNDHLPNSVHCYFLRRGQPQLPIDISVERVRGGRTYSSRRIDVRQDGKTILAMLASFHVEEPGREFDHPMPTDVPDPETLPVADMAGWDPGLDVRVVEVEGALVRWWGRIREPFPTDPAMHYCGLLYASDLRAGGAAMAAVGFDPGMRPPDEAHPVRRFGNFGSLDHAVWFHRTPVVDDWFFCEVRPLTVRDSRGLVIGTMFDRAGRHLATLTQEMFLKEDSSEG
jgi:acyl-CoA thioesterase II